MTDEDITKDGNLSGIAKRLLHGKDLPQFEARDLTLDDLVSEGDRLVFEVPPTASWLCLWCSSARTRLLASWLTCCCSCKRPLQRWYSICTCRELVVPVKLRCPCTCHQHIDVFIVLPEGSIFERTEPMEHSHRRWGSCVQQEMMNQEKLSEEYFKHSGNGSGVSMLGFG